MAFTSLLLTLLWVILTVYCWEVSFWFSFSGVLMKYVSAVFLSAAHGKCLAAKLRLTTWYFFCVYLQQDGKKTLVHLSAGV